MTISPRFPVFLFSALAVGLASAGATAQSAAEKFFEGKQITLLMGSAAGGGYDVYGRIVVKHMEKYLPKGTRFLVKSMPGASGVVMANYLVNAVEADGLTLGLCQREAPFEPIFTPKNSQAKFDPRSLEWIGSPNQEFGMFDVATASGVASVEDAMRKELKLGASGGGAAQTIVIPRIVNAMIGTKFKMIPGYTSGQEVLLALDRGEVDGRFATGWAGVEPTQAGALIAAGKARLLMTFSAERKPQVGNLPTTLEYVKKPEDRAVIELLMAPQIFGRPIFAPPGVPADRLALLRDAFDKALKDPELIAEAEKLKFDVTPVQGLALNEAIRKVYAMPEAVLTRTVEMMDAAAAN